MTEGLGGTWAATMGGEVGLSLTNIGFKWRRVWLVWNNNRINETWQGVAVIDVKTRVLGSS